jgi:DNA-binding transcriptional MocR family regulator
MYALTLDREEKKRLHQTTLPRNQAKDSRRPAGSVPKPSRRQKLTVHYRISRNVVLEAYDLLRTEASSKAGPGARALPRPTRKNTAARRGGLPYSFPLPRSTPFNYHPGPFLQVRHKPARGDEGQDMGRYPAAGVSFVLCQIVKDAPFQIDLALLAGGDLVRRSAFDRR